MPPFFGGGEMIRTVSFDGTTFADAPHKFEAGTPNIAGFVGLGAALDYVAQVGLDEIGARERALLAYATDALKSVPGLRLFGEAKAAKAQRSSHEKAEIASACLRIDVSDRDFRLSARSRENTRSSPRRSYLSSRIMMLRNQTSLP